MKSCSFEAWIPSCPENHYAFKWSWIIVSTYWWPWHFIIVTKLITIIIWSQISQKIYLSFLPSFIPTKPIGFISRVHLEKFHPWQKQPPMFKGRWKFAFPRQPYLTIDPGSTIVSRPEAGNNHLTKSNWKMICFLLLIKMKTIEFLIDLIWFSLSNWFSSNGLFVFIRSRG